MAAGDWKSAHHIYDTMAEREPHSAEVLTNLGIVYGQLGHMGTASALLELATKREPKLAEAWANLGATLRGGIRADEKIAALRKALELDPKHVVALANLSGAYVQTGNPQPGIAYARKALALDPENKTAQSNLALLLMECGQWEEAWKYIDARFEGGSPSGTKRRDYGCPMWDGSEVDSLVIHGEQGLGDEVMFLGIVAALQFMKRVRKRLVLEVAPRLVPLVRRSFDQPHGAIAGDGWPAIDVVGRPEEAGRGFDAFCPMGDLLRALKEPAPIRAASYFKPDFVRKRQWRDRMQASGPGPYVLCGLWGGVKHTHELVRNAPLEKWKPVVEAAGTAFSIQYGPNGQGMADALGIPHLKLAADDLDEQAACIAAADALVTVPQTALHLGGALGAKVFGVISEKPAWRYGLTGPMPWYGDNVTLFRKGRDEPWAGLMGRVAEAVRGLR